MKKLSYLIYLAFSVCMIAACQQENVVPGNNNQQDIYRGGPPSATGTTTCGSYSYYTRSGIVQVGTAYSGEMMVAFKPRLSMAKKEAILSQFPVYLFAAPIAANPLSGDELTYVKLADYATCADAENMRTALNQRSDVNMVLLSYLDPGAPPACFRGPAA